MNTPRAWVSFNVLVGLLPGTVLAGNIETVRVGEPGNTTDTRYATPGYGSVGYTYSIGKYEVTAGQWTAFLNAVAATDTYGLYNINMDTATNAYGCNIKRSGSPGSHTYNVPSDWANRPVNWISWGDAARFANWLSNGQPTGSQNGATTESGSYNLNGATTDEQLLTVKRNPDATWVIPNESEWYKAAYYDPNKFAGAGYWDYPTRSNTAPSNALSSAGTNNANYWSDGYSIDAPYYRTESGAFGSSPSAYGTFDQGGNVFEWNETILRGSYRGVRGGSFADSGIRMLAAYPNGYNNSTGELHLLGLRVALIPEPATFSLLAFAGAGLFARKRSRPI